jgi:hypothetical protein
MAQAAYEADSKPTPSTISYTWVYAIIITAFA